MTRTVVALFDDFNDASGAVRDLVDNGFSRDDVSLMASDPENQYSRHIGTTPEEEATGAAQGAGVGAGVGAVVGGLGGLLVGLGALTIPGIGPIIAAGPLAAALTGLAGAGAGAVAGGVTGGLLGALVDMGVPEETAQYYAEGVRRGGHLVTVRTADHMSDRAVDLLNRHNPVDINERSAAWRESGWQGFNEQGEPYTRRESDLGRGTTYDEGVRREGDFGQGTTYDEGIRRESDIDRGTTYDQGRHTETGMGGTDVGTGYGEFDTYDTRFQDHFTNSMYGTTYTYDQYRPAYRYGYDLARDDRYRDYQSWTDVEPEARRRWDERNPGTWEEFKDAVRHAWEEVKDIGR
jgi:hypothetical protein